MQAKEYYEEAKEYKDKFMEEGYLSTGKGIVYIRPPHFVWGFSGA